MEASCHADVSKFVATAVLVMLILVLNLLTYHWSSPLFWDEYPDASNAPYCLAKKMWLLQAQTYQKEYGFNAVYVLLTNMYGPSGIFDPVR